MFDNNLSVWILKYIKLVLIVRVEYVDEGYVKVWCIERERERDYLVVVYIEDSIVMFYWLLDVMIIK